MSKYSLENLKDFYFVPFYYVIKYKIDYFDQGPYKIDNQNTFPLEKEKLKF